MPVSKPYIKASIKSIVSLDIPIVHGKGVFIDADPVALISGSRYLMCLYYTRVGHIAAVEVDIDTMAVTPVDGLTRSDIQSAAFMVVRHPYILYARVGHGMLVVKDGSVQFDFVIVPRSRSSKNYYDIYGRWHQQIEDRVYMIDHKDDLYCLC